MKAVNLFSLSVPIVSLPHSDIFFIISFLIVNVVSLITIFKLKNWERGTPFFFLLIVVLIYLDAVWLATSLINPGIATNSSTEEGDFCNGCLEGGREVVMLTGQVHCEDCEVCVEERVLHFRLVGGCVGKNNFIVFKLLLLGIFMWCLSMLTIIPQVINLYF